MTPPTRVVDRSPPSMLGALALVALAISLVAPLVGTLAGALAGILPAREASRTTPPSTPCNADVATTVPGTTAFLERQFRVNRFLRGDMLGRLP